METEKSDEAAPWRSQEIGESGGPSSLAAFLQGSMPPPTPPPPPPPMAPHGSVPAVRLNTEIGPREKGPPKALAGAMLKDKKPFTYTPGGIDLSEIRSPRMAKRLQMNAAAEGVTSAPESRAAQGGVNSAPVSQLSPTAYAAMQPQMAIPVFPQGRLNLNQLSRTPKPSDFSENGTGRTWNAPTPQPIEDAGTPPLGRPLISCEKESHPGSNLGNKIGEDERSPVGTSSPAYTGTGIIYVPPLSPITPPVSKAGSQNLGSIYIPPIQSSPKSPPVALSIPQLAKAPTPWMNSYNRMATKQAESPPYVNPANTPWGTAPQEASSVGRIIPIAISRDENVAKGYPNDSPNVNMGKSQMGQEQKATAAQHLGRVIPIQIQRQESTNAQQQQQQSLQKLQQQQQQQYQQQQQQQYQQQQQQQYQQQQQQQYQQQQLQKLQQHQQQQQQQQQNQRWGTNLPIQVEVSRHPVGGPPPSIRRVVGPVGVGYNNPTGIYSNPRDGFELETGKITSAINNVSLGSERSEPTQSKSMRLIQKVAENELKRYEAEAEWNRKLMMEDERQLMSLFNAQDGGPVTHNIQIRMSPQTSSASECQVPPSEQQVPEPKKYMGANIPSRSFKMLQAMTDEPSALDSEASSPPVANNFLNNFHLSPCSLSPSEGSTDLPPTPSEQPWGDPNDPYSYMSWCYWWYYVSYYWAGFDMTGYEYPEGWDPNSPYYPPELSTDYVNVESSYVDENKDETNPQDENLPKIVIAMEGRSDCDSVRESDEESYWSCADESEKGMDTLTPTAHPEEPQDNFESEGFVEDPDTQSSEDSDATLVDEYCGRNLWIEEYISESGHPEFQEKNKLSTIEEMTEMSSSTTDSKTSLDETCEHESPQSEEAEDESQDEGSSVSVIENKSDGTRGTESKREDWTDSTDEDDDTDDDELDNAVTVRLPLKLSFGKTKSYKDITTLLVGDSEVRADEPEEQVHMKKSHEEGVIEEPVVSYTISLSRQPSREEKPDIDFWGKIIPTLQTEQKFAPSPSFTEERERGDEEQESNFWDKSVKTIERRRFSNFEISQDYESDSGIGDEGREGKRLKRYTHHTQKRHSIPGLPIWNKVSLTTKEDVEVEDGDETGDLSCGWSFWDDKNTSKLTLSVSDEEYSRNEVDVCVAIKWSVREPSCVLEPSGPSLDLVSDAEQEAEELKEDGVSPQVYGESRHPEQHRPISEETSDESSSKSSSGTTTIQQPPQPANPEEENKLDIWTKSHLKDKKASEERSIKIQELGEKIKLIGGTEESCTCHMGDRMARAESLLWRIERFLHQSLSLGSENDSGVMTDLSRQVSDVDTDADNDQNETESLLNAAAAVKDRRNWGSKGSPEVKRRRPQSEIILDTTMTSSKCAVEEECIVKMRTTSSERKSLRYQRAKTHSRLFQLLQDECGKDEEDEEEDCPEAVPTTTTTTTTMEPTMKISVDTSERRSRLLPLPLKSILVSPCNSSPSESSGLLSPTSPVTRDQLLADIISEFHLRHQDSNTILENRRRFSRFPSKIFKLLQEEFGEEFYQTFECEESESLPPAMANLHECIVHSTESVKEESMTISANSRDDSKQSTPDFLQVPLRKRVLSMDSRNYKTQNS